MEAELLALTSDKEATPRKKPRAKPIPQQNLDALVAESMRDIPTDEELSGDDDDPDLLNELNDITQGGTRVEEEEEQPVAKQEDDIVALLEKRLSIYKLAEENAKKAGTLFK